MTDWSRRKKYWRPESTDEQMRMKLKFAFGRILKTEELLDHLILDEESIEIKNGVTLKRTRMNVFSNYL